VFLSNVAALRILNGKEQLIKSGVHPDLMSFVKKYGRAFIFKAQILLQ